MQHWHKKYRTNQNQMKTRPSQQRKDRSVGTQTSFHSFSAVKPVMLKALRGHKETLPHMPRAPQPQHSTAGLEGHRCPPAFAGGDTTTLQMLPCSKGVQTRWEVLIKQNGQVGSFWLYLSPVNPAAHWRIPAQISWVDVQDPFRPRVKEKKHEDTSETIPFLQQNCSATFTQPATPHPVHTEPCTTGALSHHCWSCPHPSTVRELRVNLQDDHSSTYVWGQGPQFVHVLPGHALPTKGRRDPRLGTFNRDQVAQQKTA